MNKTIGFAKFTAVAIALGFISPTISVENTPTSSTISNVEFSIINSAQAREVKKKNSVKKKNTNKNVNVNRNKTTNKNVNVNRNSNKNVNVNVNNNNRRGVRPLGVLTGMAIGATVVSSAMSPSCTTVLVNGIHYRNCSGTYFQPRGTSYVVVTSPY